MPKRGEKDFEPNGTNLQTQVLKESRNAMYTALQGERGHYGKAHITATWFGDVGKARVDVAKGPHFTTIGKSDSSGKVWLLPEELVYLVERGSLECFFEQGAPMSLQAVYSVCIKQSGDLEKLQVYTYLKKLGFIVMRAPSYSSEYSCIYNSPYKVVPKKETFYNIFSLCLLNAQTNFYSIFFESLRTASKYYSPLKLYVPKPFKFILERPVYRDYSSIYDDLDIIPFHEPPHSNIIENPFTTPEPEAPYRVAFNVWKPSASTFKKSSPPQPDFRVAVISSRDNRVPTLQQTLSLLNSAPVTEDGYSVTRKKEIRIRSQTWELKDGWRNVILAVIDAGVISFTKVTDPGFGGQRIYVKPSNQKKKTSGQKK